MRNSILNTMRVIPLLFLMSTHFGVREYFRFGKMAVLGQVHQEFVIYLCFNVVDIQDLCNSPECMTVIKDIYTVTAKPNLPIKLCQYHIITRIFHVIFF